MNCAIREMRPDEYPMLRTFLYQAIYQEEGAKRLPLEVVDQPALAAYIDGFGRPGDHCLVADVDGVVAGAVWTRVFQGEAIGYGTIDAVTPELSISLLPEVRGQGIGSALMRAMLELLAAYGHTGASLSVQKRNPAFRLYQRLGFQVFRETGQDCVMVWTNPS